MVLSDIRGCQEIGADGEHLLLTPPRDADALTTAVTRLLDDPALRDRLGSAAGARARIEFDQVRIATSSLQTYAAVARRRGLGWELP